MKASVLLDEAISLPVEERAHLVDCLLQTLNPPDATHAAAWAVAARRRLDELKTGIYLVRRCSRAFSNVTKNDFWFSFRGRG